MKYTPKLRPYTSAVSAAVALAIAAPFLAIAQPAFAADDDDVAIEEVIVTGSRIRTGRQAPSIPIDTATADDIKYSGYPNVEEVLNNMPQFVPERTASTNSTADPTATGAATLNLRGLGGQRTLVLVNGRRYTFFDSSQRTDINNIPASLIERVEVVTGGASAVYGSDAIGGVVNFILKDDFEGVEIRSQFNQTSEGDGDVADVSLTIGGNFADDKGNAVVVFNYLNRDPIMTTDRNATEIVLGDFTNSSGEVILAQNGSSFIPNGRFQGIPFTPTAIAAIPGLDAALAAAGLTGITNNGFTNDGGLDQRLYSGANATSPGDTFNYTLDNFLRVPQERYAVTTLVNLDVSDSATIYFEGAFSHNETTTGFASSFINQSFPVEVNNPYISPELSDVLLLLDENGTGGPADDGQVNLTINRRLVELGPRINNDSRDAFRALAGVKGTISDYDYNAYASYTRSDNTQIQIGNASRSAFGEGILSGSGGPGGDPILNPFGANLSPEGVEFLNIATTNTEATELKVFGATVSRDLFDMSAGPVAALLGTEWRSSSVNFRPDQSLLTGDVAGFNAITPAKGEIDVWEFFAEFSVPLLADKTGIQALNATGAYRYSNYDLEETDGVNTYLVGLDWQVNDSLAFGSQFQRAIRAPSVGEAFNGQRLFPVSATDPCALPSAATDATIRGLCEAKGVPSVLVGDSSIQPNNEIPGLFGGNPNLNEEESDTFTLSAIITPTALPNLRVSIDYFDISIDDTIGRSGGSVNNVLDLCYVQIQDLNSGACLAAGRNSSTGVIDTLNPVGVVNANVGSLKTSGIDLQISYVWEFDFGIGGSGSELNVRFDSTFMDKLNLTPIAGLDTVNKCAGAYGRTCGEPKSETKTNTSVSWTSGDLRLGLRYRWADETRLDEVVFDQRAPESVASLDIGGDGYLDLSFGYDFTDEFAIWGGIINALDEDPPRLGRRQVRANTSPDTFSPTGAEFFLGGSYKF